MSTIETPAFHDQVELDAADRLADRHAPAGRPDPPDPVDHQVASPSRIVPERVVETLGLPHHPDPKVIAGHLRAAARLLEDNGARARRAAAGLAARGWAAATMGDGTGSRTSTTSSSVERAARTEAENQDPGHWDDIDVRLARLLRIQWQTAAQLEAMVTDLLTHASDVDPLPAGQGECQCCGHTCVPSKNRSDRLKSNLCPACYKALQRAGTVPSRSDWMHARRHRLFDGQAGVCVACERPWTANVEQVPA